MIYSVDPVTGQLIETSFWDRLTVFMGSLVMTVFIVVALAFVISIVFNGRHK